MRRRGVRDWTDLGVHNIAPPRRRTGEKEWKESNDRRRRVSLPLCCRRLSLLSPSSPTPCWPRVRSTAHLVYHNQVGGFSLKFVPRDDYQWLRPAGGSCFCCLVLTKGKRKIKIKKRSVTNFSSYLSLSFVAHPTKKALQPKSNDYSSSLVNVAPAHVQCFRLLSNRIIPPLPLDCIWRIRIVSSSSFVVGTSDHNSKCNGQCALRCCFTRMVMLAYLALRCCGISPDKQEISRSVTYMLID